MPDDNPAGRLQKLKESPALKEWGGCSLFMALPALTYTGICFILGNAPLGFFALKGIAAILILCPIVTHTLYGGHYIEAGIPCGIVVVLGCVLTPGFLQARAKAQSATCLTNMKRLALGTLMYAQDYDDVLPHDSTAFKTLVFPYIQDRTAFVCPLDPPTANSYAFNSNLANVSRKAITSLDQTILIYEGKSGKLTYRHEGRATIGFADGHCRICKPEQAMTLQWMVPLTQKR